jgi:hypothetical protein
MEYDRFQYDASDKVIDQRAENNHHQEFQEPCGSRHHAPMRATPKAQHLSEAGLVLQSRSDLTPFRKAFPPGSSVSRQNKGPVPFETEPFASESRQASTALSQRFRCGLTVSIASSKACFYSTAYWIDDY